MRSTDKLTIEELHDELEGDAWVPVPCEVIDASLTKVRIEQKCSNRAYWLPRVLLLNGQKVQLGDKIVHTRRWYADARRLERLV